MTIEGLSKFVIASLERADKALRAAKRLFEDGETEDAASRAYYSMFHAASALLSAKSIKFKTHKSVVGLFGSEIVKKGIMEAEYGRMINKAFDLRDRADYKVLEKVTKGEVEETLKNAEKFIRKVKEVLGLKVQG